MESGASRLFGRAGAAPEEPGPELVAFPPAALCRVGRRILMMQAGEGSYELLRCFRRSVEPIHPPERLLELCRIRGDTEYQLYSHDSTSVSDATSCALWKPRIHPSQRSPLIGR